MNSRRIDGGCVEKATSTLEQAVTDALRTVDDPEYPGLSVLDLGLVESVAITEGAVSVGLIPTFSGCPALHMIAADVEAALHAVSGVETCTVEWLPGPVWTTDRLSEAGQAHLSAEFTVTLRTKDGTLRCPVCGSIDVKDQSIAGPTRCRSVAWCNACRNPVEVFR
ncbi:MAG: ring-1,2-phenylacetyl-CoA epoxidase subunit PaaD [Acidimicrobiales bacterium]|jgi:ring-1,2-phenylacetyl-CoA epoxidase subunit PaaD